MNTFARLLLVASAGLLAGACGSDPTDAPSGQGDEQADDGGGARYPVVLVHAFHATTSNGWSLERVRDVLEADGHFVRLASLSRFAGTPTRARELVPQLDEARRAFCRDRHPAEDPGPCFSRTKVHIVGHSQGGLDARFAVSALGYAPDTASVITLSTPHGGTPLGDVGLSLLGDPRAERSTPRTVELALGSLVKHLVPDDLQPAGLADAFYWLSEARFHAGLAAGAEEEMADADGVVYESWAGIATSDGELPDIGVCDGKGRFPLGRAAELRGLADNATFTIVAGAFDADSSPNDGHIPVRSAQHGIFRGCLPADHLDLIGRPDDQSERNADRTGFDYEAFYRELGASLRSIEAAEVN